MQFHINIGVPAAQNRSDDQRQRNASHAAKTDREKMAEKGSGGRPSFSAFTDFAPFPENDLLLAFRGAVFMIVRIKRLKTNQKRQYPSIISSIRLPFSGRLAPYAAKIPAGNPPTAAASAQEVRGLKEKRRASCSHGSGALLVQPAFRQSTFAGTAPVAEKR